MKRAKTGGVRHKGHVVAYLRVSATDQKLDTQLAKVKVLGNVDRVFKEKVRGLKQVRPALAECLAYLREGDTLVVARADRIARSAGRGWSAPSCRRNPLALKENGIAIPDIARRLNLGVSTIYRLLAEQKEPAA
jgi:DNA invertase Pin-like site-specific DNA recombinase